MQQKITHSLKLISDAIEQYPNIALFSSFGKDSMCILHLARRINPNIQVVSVMTPYKFIETRSYKDYISRRWRLNIETYEASLVIANNGKKNLYEEDYEKCCNYYKVEPTKQAIEELKIDCWISGLRGTEGHTRKFLDEIEVRDGLVKINPILKWTEADVWLYHCANNITPNPLYLQGYRSLGCKPCTLPNTETERGGRWLGSGMEGKECGIHTQSLVAQKKMPVIDASGLPKRDEGKF